MQQFIVIKNHVHSKVKIQTNQIDKYRKTRKTPFKAYQLVELFIVLALASFQMIELRTAQPPKNTKQFDNDVKKKTITACFLFSSNLFFSCPRLFLCEEKSQSKQKQNKKIIAQFYGNFLFARLFSENGEVFVVSNLQVSAYFDIARVGDFFLVSTN